MEQGEEIKELRKELQRQAQRYFDTVEEFKRMVEKSRQELEGYKEKFGSCFKEKQELWSKLLDARHELAEKDAQIVELKAKLYDLSNEKGAR